MSKLFCPGPIDYPESIKPVLSADPPYFANHEFNSVLKRIQPKLQALFCTTNPVLIGTGSGTLGMESAIANFFKAGDRVIVIDHGKYGENWFKMCVQRGISGSHLKPVIQGDIVPPEELKACLKGVDGVLIQHVETTTATISPIKEYLQIIREYGDPKTLTILDAVSSLGSEPLISDDWDVVLGASQKALSLPPGLFFMSVSKKALQVSLDNKTPRFYFDVPTEIKRTENNQTSHTPATNIILALDIVLDEILQIGLEAVYQNVRDNAEIFREYFAPHELFGNGANSLTAVLCNESKIVEGLKNNGYIVGNGVRSLAGKMIRVRHFGYKLDPEDTENLADMISYLMERD